MGLGLSEPSRLLPVAGMRLGVAQAGIGRAGRNDLLLMELGEDSIARAVFTRNAFRAAPVVVAERHLASGTAPRYVLVNSGNANAGMGEAGLAAALACCEAVAVRGACPPEAVLPFSTGVIGEPLPVERIRAALPGAYAGLEAEGWRAAASAIMTTDTVSKGHSLRVETKAGDVTITGIAKGAGMIRPDMATMLAFVATDARLPPRLLDEALREAVGASFNRITVDGDTSTNDACLLVATGRGPVIEGPGEDYRVIAEALREVCVQLAQSIVRDGEGATRFITVAVEEGADEAECLAVAYAVAHSPLVKTAFFAGDPNWGRILAAVGRAGLPDLAIEPLRIYLDEVCIVSGGARAPDYRESDGQRVMARQAITIRIVLGRGSARATVWTTDLSYEYVRINAEYRT